VKIDVEDDGRVNVASADGESAARAISIIQELTATPELNKTYLGKVQRITDFGAFVEIMPGTDGLLHVSEIANHRVKDVRDELKEGDEGRRTADGQGDQHRPDRQDSPEPEGPAPGRSRRRAKDPVSQGERQAR
jgi:polyribonucleotide nucleotidyltransferase